MHSVVHQDLICAFTGLSLHTVHETTSENDDLLAEDYAGVAVSSDDAVIGAVVYLLPVGFVGAGGESGDLVVAFVVLATDEVAIVIDAFECGVFSRCWDPPLRINHNYLRIKRLPLLHPLHISLQPTRQTLSQLIPRNIIRWLCLKLLRPINILFHRR